MSSRPTRSQTQKLIRAAKQALKNAYAPYSHFHVGAALLTVGGKIVSGCNVENASYGLTLCAERAVLVQAVSRGETKFAAMAIASDPVTDLTPCGACRQVLLELAPDLWVLSERGGGRLWVKQVKELLPDGFRLSKEDRHARNPLSGIHLKK